MKTELTVHQRDPKENADALRSEGLIPAVYYGQKQKPVTISIDKREFQRVWKEAGESTVVSLLSDGKKVDTVINDVQVDPVSEVPIHADFYVFQKGQRIEVSVPLEFVGEAPAVKHLGGVLVKVLHDLSVEAEPANLPGNLEVDTSVLNKLDDQILARDIKLPEGVELTEDPEEVVVSVYEGQEESEAEAEEMDISDIEVEGEKAAEEGEGSAEGEASSEE